MHKCTHQAKIPDEHQPYNLRSRPHAWLSGSALVSINVVTLRRARLVLGCVTVCGRVIPVC